MQPREQDCTPSRCQPRDRMNQNWPKSGPQFILFWWAGFGPNLGLFYLLLADIWPGYDPHCGKDLANRSYPPKCHHSLRYVGLMNAYAVGRIWARTGLLPGNQPMRRNVGVLLSSLNLLAIPSVIPCKQIMYQSVVCWRSDWILNL